MWKVIYSENCEKESEVLRSFFEWQRKSVEFVDDKIECMRLTGGKPAPCLMCNGFLVSVGFFSILKEYDHNGYRLC